MTIILERNIKHVSAARTFHVFDTPTFKSPVFEMSTLSLAKGFDAGGHSNGSRPPEYCVLKKHGPTNQKHQEISQGQIFRVENVVFLDSSYGVGQVAWVILGVDLG